jgi:hypothetical protein
LAGLPRESHVSVVDRAVAAVGNGPVVHLIEPFPATNYAEIDIATGKERVPVREAEFWIDPERAVIHQIERQDGVVVTNDLLTTSGTYSYESGTVLPPSPRKFLTVPEGLRGFATGYREALASGAAHVDREGTLDGRAVYWLRFTEHQETDPYTQQVTRFADEVAIDRESYKPVAVRTIVNGEPSEILRISLIENVSRDDANFERPKLEPMPRGEDVIETKEITAAAAAATLGATPVWAGDAVAGLPLTGVYEQTLKTSYPREADVPPVVRRGVVFVYGTPPDVGHGVPFGSADTIAIRESPRQEGDYGWQQNPPLAPPPPGFVRRGGPYFLLQQDGVYVSIQAAGKDTALAVARALRPYEG